MRLAFIGRGRVVKIPRFLSWRVFLEGMIANLQERELSRRYSNEEKLCPVIWADPLGLAVVMPFARPMTDEEWEPFDVIGFCDLQNGSSLPIECGKRDTYGVIAGRVVAVDYGGAWA
jgi:hypothetical protein